LVSLGGGKKPLVILIGGGLVFLLLIVVLINGLISNANKADTESLVKAAKQQQELIRISDIGIQKAKTQSAKNIAVTTKLSLASQQSAMETAIKAAGLNPKKVLVVSANAETDKALETAEQNNRFDEEFLKIMSANLVIYQKSVKTAYSGATSKKLKAALDSQYKSANTLAGVASTGSN